MGGRTGNAVASLQRLKKLDASYDLSSQLDEAQQLCNHGARAEMIVRWLLDVLRKNPEARLEPRVWDLLSASTQIVSVDKLATYLKPCDILRIIQITLTIDSRKLSDQLVDSLGSFCQSLKQISRRFDGSPVQAVFALDAGDAASYLGAWLQSSLQADRGAQLNPEDLSMHGDRWKGLDAALDVWRMRKATTDADLLFSKECLLPAGRVLLDAYSEHDRASSQHKSKRHSFPYVAEMERLLACHIFLPTRNAFLSSMRTTPQSAEQDRNQHQLDALLKPMTIDPHSADLSPALLGIALRCIPSNTTLKQRQREIPWIENLIKVLRKVENHSDTQNGALMLTDLLALVEKYRYSLSRSLLGNIVHEQIRKKDHDSPSRQPSWHLIEQVIRLDPDVFMYRDDAESLFLLITDAAHRDFELKSSFHTIAKPDLCRKILTPVMKMFASHRSIATFVELWHAQLVASAFQNISDAPWFELQPAFSEILEETMSSPQLEQMVRSYSERLPLKAIADEYDAGSSATCQAFATIVVLDAIVAGVKDDDTIDTVLSELETVLRKIINLCNDEQFQKGRIVQDWHVWTLVTRLLKICYPRWAVSLDPHHNRVAQIEALFLDKNEGDTVDYGVMRLARQLSVQDFSRTKQPKRQQRLALAAQEFALTVLEALLECQRERWGQQVVTFISQTSHVSPALLKHPTLMSRLDSGFLSEVLTAWTKADFGGLGYRQAWQSLLEAFSDISTHGVREYYHILVAQLKDDDLYRSLAAAEVLSQSNNLRHLSPPQRREVVNLVLGQISNRTTTTTELLQSHLALAARVFEHADLGADVTTKAESLLKLIDSGFERHLLCKNKYTPTPLPLDQTALNLFEIVLEAVMKQICSPRNQQRNLSMLNELATSISRYCTLWTKMSAPSVVLLASINIIIQQISTTGEACTKLDATELEQYIMHLLKMVQSQKPQTNTVLVTAILSSLYSITEATLRYAGIDIDVYREKLAEKTRLMSFDLENDRVDESSAVQAAWRFRIVCRWRIDRGYAEILQCGVRLLRSNLPSKLEHDTLQDFSRWMASPVLESTRRWSIMRQLMSSSDSDLSAACILLDKAISACPESDQATVSKSTMNAFFDDIITKTSKSRSFAIRRHCCECVMTVLKEKPFMTNQYTIEQCFLMMKSMVEATSHSNNSYMLACRVLTVLLQQYRSRIRDRMHLVVAMLQIFISNLFRPLVKASSSMTADARGQPRQRPLSRQAQTLSRAVQLLCNPPAMRGRSQTVNLVDQVRRTRASVGSFLPPVLHQYCADVLGGGLAEDVREALQPAIWIIIETMEVHHEDAVTILSAAMDNSERAILRSVYDDYKTMHKRKVG